MAFVRAWRFRFIPTLKWSGCVAIQCGSREPRFLVSAKLRVRYEGASQWLTLNFFSPPLLILVADLIGIGPRHDTSQEMEQTTVREGRLHPVVPGPIM